MIFIRTWTKSLLLAVLVVSSQSAPAGQPTTTNVISANTDCTILLNGDTRQCCPKSATTPPHPKSGSCQDSSCTVFGFPNSARANCHTGPNSNCPYSLCEWEDPNCITNAENHCYGRVVCVEGIDACTGLGEYCLQDGNSNNFKICANPCKNDKDCASGSTCDKTQDPSQCVGEDGSATFGTITIGTTTAGTIAVETRTGGTATDEKTTVGTATVEASSNGNSNNDKKVRTGWPQDGCDEPTADTYPEFEEGDGVACSFQDVLDLLKDYDCKIPKSACNECFCDIPLPPDVVAQLKACAILNDYNSNTERIIDNL